MITDTMNWVKPTARLSLSISSGIFKESSKLTSVTHSGSSEIFSALTALPIHLLRKTWQLVYTSEICFLK